MWLHHVPRQVLFANTIMILAEITLSILNQTISSGHKLRAACLSIGFVKQAKCRFHPVQSPLCRQTKPVFPDQRQQLQRRCCRRQMCADQRHFRITSFVSSRKARHRLYVRFLRLKIPPVSKSTCLYDVQSKCVSQVFNQRLPLYMYIFQSSACRLTLHV